MSIDAVAFIFVSIFAHILVHICVNLQLSISFRSEDNRPEHFDSYQSSIKRYQALSQRLVDYQGEQKSDTSIVHLGTLITT